MKIGSLIQRHIAAEGPCGFGSIVAHIVEQSGMPNPCPSDARLEVERDVAIEIRNLIEDGALEKNYDGDYACRWMCQRCGTLVKVGELNAQGWCGACEELLVQVADATDEYADWDF